MRMGCSSFILLRSKQTGWPQPKVFVTVFMNKQMWCIIRWAMPQLNQGAATTGIMCVGFNWPEKHLVPRDFLSAARPAELNLFFMRETERNRARQRARERKKKQTLLWNVLARRMMERRQSYTLTSLMHSVLSPASVFTILLTKKYSPWADQPPTSVCPHDVNLKHLKTSGRLH